MMSFFRNLFRGSVKSSVKGSMAALAVTAGAAADADGSRALAQEAPPVVVELFTSQGCYSCPPAEKLLGKLAKQDGILALEFHVDYWDDLNYFIHGKWKDPYSSPLYTRRQQFYNLDIRGKGGVYTPQMVIDGRLEAVGSRTRDVARAIQVAARDAAPRVSVKIAKGSDGLKAVLDGNTGERAGIWYVEFLKERTTKVKSGENHGKTLVSHNIVVETKRIGEWTGRKTQVKLPNPSLDHSDRGCAILVQAGPGKGRILGAAQCPKVTS